MVMGLKQVLAQGGSSILSMYSSFPNLQCVLVIISKYFKHLCPHSILKYQICNEQNIFNMYSICLYNIFHV